MGNEAHKGLVADVVIRSKDGWDKLHRLVDSLAPVRDRIRLILVDDGSTPADPPDCDVIVRHSKPRGAVSATNSGLSISLLHEDTQYVMVMDNDCWAPDGDTGWLDRMVAEMERAGEKTACMGATTNYANQPQHILSVPQTYTGDWDSGTKDNPPVPYFISFCCMMRKPVVRKVGYWDEQFNPGNWEDTDYGVQLRVAGYELRVAQSVYFHHDGHSTFGEDLNRLLEENQQKFIQKWGIGRLTDLGVVSIQDAANAFSILAKQ